MVIHFVVVLEAMNSFVASYASFFGFASTVSILHIIYFYFPLQKLLELSDRDIMYKAAQIKANSCFFFQAISAINLKQFPNIMQSITAR